MLLYPQSNAHRQKIQLAGFWDFRFDPEVRGQAEKWATGFDAERYIAISASWNDQFADHRDYLGHAWYQTTFTLPWGWEDQRIFVRFGSVYYFAEVWLNGQRLGEHEGGHLPFVFDITDHVIEGENRLVLCVDGIMTPQRIPPGNLPRNRDKPVPVEADFGRTLPDTSYDFFPYCGINRPVHLFTTPVQAIEDVTAVTEIDGVDGVVRVEIEPANAQYRVTLSGHGFHETWTGGSHHTCRVPQAALWSPQAPNLYTLQVERLAGDTVVDSYQLNTGIRTVAIRGEQILLNGEPVKLIGFGRHEDFPVVGRGMLPALIIKDYALMNWIGANSFRTSHYPYSDEMMDMADRLGFLVIGETPIVGLRFDGDGLEDRLKLSKQFVREMIARDKNHPSIIMWSLANEPISHHPDAYDFFKALAELSREMDDSRPITLVSNLVPGLEKSFEFLDLVSINLYRGWYSEQGRFEEAIERLSGFLDGLHDHFKKPVFMTEFGADTVVGHHALEPEMFSEEYQVEFLTRYIELLNSKSYVIGHHVWNMCDFKTGQGTMRVGALNLKGVFTRDRKPKMAAYRLKSLWTGERQ